MRRQPRVHRRGMADLDSRPPELRGLVLAGGLSERFGRDKAGALIEGQTLLERAVETLGAVVSDVRVAVRQDQMNESAARPVCAPCRCSRGNRARGGHSRRASVATRRGMAGACLRHATRYARNACHAHRAIAIPRARRPPSARRTDGLPEPLCAIYEPATLARFRHQVEAGGNPEPAQLACQRSIPCCWMRPARMP